MKSMIVIPTYNERENVQKLVPILLSLPLDLEVTVVDDNSPDGTAEAVRTLAGDDGRVHVIERPGKMGLGSAYVRGFKFALQKDADLVFEMDADFSHDPAAIPEFVAAAVDADLVLGSRYLTGVTVVNWPLRRLILSYSANLYTRLVTGMPVHDATGGFKCFKRRVLESIDLDSISSDGYSFQIEMSYKCWKKGFKIVEIPITFTDRRVGVSKMSNKIIWEAVWMVWGLRWGDVTGRW